MTARKQVWRGMSVVAPAQAMAQAMGLVRNIIIARLLSPTDVGVAALLAATLAFIELLSDVSTDKVLVQSARGNEPMMQKTAQAVMLLRGIGQACVLGCLAWPIAWFFDVRGAWWAFACVAGVPLIKGLINLDPVRRQRELKYGASLTVEVMPQVLATAMAWPLAAWLDSYAAVVCLSIGQAVTQVALSHVLAERRYGLAWDRESLKTLSAFALPLLLNGVLLFATNQGDKAVIGAAYSVKTLGVYYVAALLIGAPVAMLAKTSIAIGLPMLSRVQDSQAAFLKRYSMVIEWLCVMGALLAVVSMLAGGMLVALVSKQKYAGAGEYTAFIGAMMAVWMVRVGPTLAAMARGDTVNALATNVTRALALVGVIAVAAAGLELKWVVACGIAGEIAALLVSTSRLSRKHGVPMGLTWKPMGLVVLAVALSAGIDLVWVTGHGWGWTIAVVCAASAGVAVAAVVVCPALREEGVRVCRAVRAVRGVARV
ncbi:MAG: oligosaccharide flippase family protein [Phycisphaerales bacterium]